MGTLAFNNMSGIGRSGTGVLKVDGKEVARQTMERTLPFILQWDENFDIGADTGTPVAEDYQVPFRFTGKLNKLTLKIDRPQLTPADIEKLRQATRTTAQASSGDTRAGSGRRAGDTRLSLAYQDLKLLVL